MRNQYRTYMKREIKKTYPLLILGILFLVFMGITATSMTKGRYEGALLEMSDHFSEHMAMEMGETVNLFINAVFGGSFSAFYTMAILVFVVMLLQQTFLHENRSGIADFLQVLPLRERDKVILKLINAHVAIAIYTLSFGVIYSLCCLSVNGSLQKVSELYNKSYHQINPYGMIWQSVLLQFLGTSAIYLVLFLTIMCIHNRFLSYAVGIGLLISPAAFSLWYDDILCYGQDRGLLIRYFLPCYFFPETTYVDASNGMSYTLIQWEGGYKEHIFLYLGIIVVAAALIVLAVSQKWHIREANNVLMNEEVAAQFVITGIAFCFALFGADFMLQIIWYNRNYSMESYWGVCVIQCVIFYIILSIIRRLLERRRQM